MSLQLSVLGSGSSGNATLLRITEADADTGVEQERYFLIDAGFSPRAISRRMKQLGVERQQLEAIILTHMHSDHFRESWLDVCKKDGLHVYLHQRHYRLWCKFGRYDLATTRFERPFQLTPSTWIKPFTLPHDQQTSAGLLFEHDGLRLGFLTDLGHMPEAAYKHFTAMDMLAIESNYDPVMQQASPRPAFLKRRVMGQNGHLSNEQSLRAVQRFATNSGLGRILLLHLSQQCNDPEIIRGLYAAEAPHLVDRLLPTAQGSPTEWITLEATSHPTPPGQPTEATPKGSGLITQMDLF